MYLILYIEGLEVAICGFVTEMTKYFCEKFSKIKLVNKRLRSYTRDRA